MTDMKTDELIALYAIYQSEWEYRDQTIWNIMKMMITIEIAIIAVPFVYGELLQQYEKWLFLFPVLAMIINGIFIYVLFRALKRFRAIADTITKVNNKLREDYQKSSFTEKTKVSLFSFIIIAVGITFVFISISEVIVLKLM